MEQKNMDKIKKLYNLVATKNRSLEERYKAIKESLFTPETKKLMLVLNDHYKRAIVLDKTVELQFVDKDVFHNNVFILKYRDTSERRLTPWDLPQIEYTDSFINLLESRVQQSKEIDQRLTFIEDHMEEFIDKLSQFYKEYVEKESDKLDALLAEMDYEVKPVKHLKVTVEWV